MWGIHEEKHRTKEENFLLERNYVMVVMSHSARTCNDRQICQIYWKKHPTGLHGYFPKKKPGDENSVASDGTEGNVTFKSNCANFDNVNCVASCNGEIVSMDIVPVKIKYVSEREEVTTYALLDNSSQETFVREDIIYILEVSGAGTKKTVKTKNGWQPHLSTAVDSLQAESNKKSIEEQWIKLLKSYTTSEFTDDAKEVAAKERLRKWKYLDSLCKKICQDGNIKIGIMTRAN